MSAEIARCVEGTVQSMIIACRAEGFPLSSSDAFSQVCGLVHVKDMTLLEVIIWKLFSAVPLESQMARLFTL